MLPQHIPWGCHPADCMQDPGQRVSQLERDNQQLRRELEHARRLLAAPDRPAVDAAMESGLKVHVGGVTAAKGRSSRCSSMHVARALQSAA